MCWDKQDTQRDKDYNNVKREMDDAKNVDEFTCVSINKNTKR